MSLTLFAKMMEELSVYGDSSFQKFVKDPHKYKESKTDLKLYTLKHFLGLYHDDFYKYHGYFPHYLADEEETANHEIIRMNSAVLKDGTTNAIWFPSLYVLGIP